MKCGMETLWGWLVLCSTSSKNLTLHYEMVLSTITFESSWVFCSNITCKCVVLLRSVFFVGRYSFGSWKWRTFNNENGWTWRYISLQLQEWPCKWHNLCFWMWTNQQFCWCSSKEILADKCPVAAFRIGCE